MRRRHICVNYLRRRGYLEEMKALFLVARLLALFPLVSGDSRKNKEGPRVCFKKCLVALYSITGYSSLAFLSMIHLKHRALTLGSTMNVSFYLSVSYVVSVFVIPCTHWGRSCLVKEYLRRWSEFEATYWRVTGTTLKLNARVMANSSCLLLIAASFITVSLQLFIQPGYKIWYVAIVSYAIICKGVMELIWIFTFVDIREASRQLADKMDTFVDVITANNKEPSLACFRNLWYQLSALAKDSGNVLYPAYCVTFFVNFAIMALCFYAVISGYAVNLHGTINLMLQGLAAMGSLYFSIHFAQEASKEVTSGILKELVRLSDNDVSIGALRQVNEFLNEMAMNLPTVSLGEYVNVDKEFFFTILSTLVTYLIVLLQVRISL